LLRAGVVRRTFIRLAKSWSVATLSSIPRWLTVSLLCLAIVVVYGVLFTAIRQALTPHPAVARAPVPTVTYASEFTFADSVPIADRRWIVRAVGRARPEAVRLIELIDDHTTVAPLRDGSAAGRTWDLPSGRHRIRLALERLDRDMRANRELILLHELGHAIDHQLVSDALRDRLVAELPATGSCPAARFGDCAPPEEKFADTFAKWASRGAVYHYGAGYQLAVPRSLDVWGAPLSRMAKVTPLPGTQ
jgi:hypothetical protein